MNKSLEELEKRIEQLEEKLQIYSMAAASAYAQFRFSARGGEYRLNLIKPKTFNEKLMWLRENYWAYNPITYYNMDKYFFKYYSEKLFGKEHSIPLEGVWDKAEDIDFSILPDKFVIKRSLSGGSFEVKICDKKTDDLEKIRRLAASWLADPKRVRARIVAERQLDVLDNGYIYDYKFFVINGKVRFIYVLRNKLGEKRRYHCFYDLDWKKIPVKDYHPYIEEEVKPPVCLNEMINFAAMVGKLFPLMRVDLYVENGKFYLGELTDVSNEGMAPLNPIEFDKKWGSMITLPTDDDIRNSYDYFYSVFPELKTNPVFLRNNLSNYFIVQPNSKDNSLPVPPEPFMQPMKRMGK